MQLTKTDFIQFLNCPKSVWLMHKDPKKYPESPLSDFDQKLIREGYEFEGHVKALFSSFDNASDFEFQATYKTDGGLLARVDIVRNKPDGSIALYEIKSSTEVKTDKKHHHLEDAAFQTVVATRAGETVTEVYIVHLNKKYVREGAINPEHMVSVSDVTDRVSDILPKIEKQMDEALDFLQADQIDRSSCTCLLLSKGHHCNSFDYFNPDLPDPSIYNLPSLWGKRLENFVTEGRFELSDINLDEVTKQQKPVLAAFQNGGQFIDRADIQNFFDTLEYPLYFLDYEAYGSAIPLIDGLSPHDHLPFQFSLHIMQADGSVSHVEYLAEEMKLPEKLVDALVQNIGGSGSVIAWHKTYENERNKHLAKLYPQHEEFLLGLVERTKDLEDVFKTSYVDIAFGGSSSIKKVLPVIVPDLTYEGMDIAEGTAAMDAWAKMDAEKDSDAKAKLRKDLLAYCELDTLAMVRIFEYVKSVLSSA